MFSTYVTIYTYICVNQKIIGDYTYYYPLANSPELQENYGFPNILVASAANEINFRRISQMLFSGKIVIFVYIFKVQT